MSDNKTINIMIIGGNYVGKGAEAMMLVVIEQIKKKFANARFWATPKNAEEARKMKSAGINLIYQKKKSRIARIPLILYTILGGKFSTRDGCAVSGEKLDNVFAVSDFVMDISGFASSDQRGARVAFYRWLKYKMAVSTGNKLLFLPQSWGPFKNTWVRLFTRWTLKRASFLCAREISSFHYLTEFCIVKPSKINYYKDIAFLFHMNNSESTAWKQIDKINLKNSRLPFITLTPNMRIYERVQGEEAHNIYVQVLVETINDFLSTTDFNIVLIPHEASTGKPNDTELCTMIMKLLNCPERVGLLSADMSAIQIKEVIGTSIFLVASRYHSLIAALSMRTPVAVVGWSHKYNELMELAGLADFNIDFIHTLNKGMTVKILIGAFQKRDIIAKKINRSIPLIEEDVKSVFDRVEGIINNELACRQSVST